MSGVNDRVVYSWDTNVFLALLKKEADQPLADINAVADEIEQGKADLVVSAVVIAEMLSVFDDPALAVRFNAFLRRPNVFLANVDARVARKTAELRFQWRADQSHGSSNRNIKTPDAIILATAVLYQVTVLHTFDPPMKRHHKSALLSGLSIIEPMLHGGQLVLDLPHDAAKSEPTVDATAGISSAVETPLKPDEAASAKNDAHPVAVGPESKGDAVVSQTLPVDTDPAGDDADSATISSK